MERYVTKPCQLKLQAQAPHCSLIWETLSIAFEGKVERHFPRQFSQIKDSFQPTGTSFITIEGKYLWLFPLFFPPAGNLASHSCCKTPIGDFLRLFAVLWSEIYIIYCVYVTYFKLLLRLFAVFWSFRKVQFDQNVNCSDGGQFYFANFVSYLLCCVRLIVMVLGLCLLCKMMKVNLDKILGQNMFQRLPKILRIVQLFPPPQSFSDKGFVKNQHDINLVCSKFALTI